jgi:protein-S-isoprenylcysteine O-methyltransferase Ste14
MTNGFWLAMGFALGWIPLFCFRTESYLEVRRSYQGAERLWTTLAPAFIGIHCTVSCFALSFVEITPWRLITSAAVFAFALAFWFWGRPMISPLTTRVHPDNPPLEFHRDGAFGVVRHPLFFSYLVASTAPLIAVPYLSLFTTYVLCVVALIIRARQEERRLHAQLGPAYERYCRQVARLIPFVW